jgi:hypothetical protein
MFNARVCVVGSGRYERELRETLPGSTEPSAVTTNERVTGK